MRLAIGITTGVEVLAISERHGAHLADEAGWMVMTTERLHLIVSEQDTTTTPGIQVSTDVRCRESL